MKGLIIGLGSIGRKHANAIRSIDDKIELYALRSSQNDESESYTRDIYSYDEVDKVGFDFVIVSNPSSLHLETIEQVIKLEIPIFLEKPAITQKDKIAELEQKLSQYKSPTYVGCNLRFFEGLSFVKEYIKEKKINEVNIYAGSFLPEWRPDTDYKTSYSAQASFGGGVHLDLIHEIDYAYWFWGTPEEVKSLKRSRSTIDVESIDYANYNLMYPKFAVNIILNYYRRDYKRTAEFVLDNETVELNFATNSVYKPDGQIYFSSDQTILDTYKDQMSYFLNLVQTGGDSFNTILDGLEVLKICLSE